MTYRVAITHEQPDVKTTVTREGVHMNQMKDAIKSMVANNALPVSSTIHVVEEQTNKVFFRNVLSSLSFIK